ncbi:MAG: TVP38/TMEM64 family protein [Planctomycetaceae bacterium]
MPSASSRRFLLLALGGGTLGLLATWLARSGVLGPLLTRLSELVREWGPWGPVALGLLYLPVCLLMLPGSPLTLLAGFVFGQTLGGFLWTLACLSLGSTLGATAAFLAGRTLARDAIRDRVAQSPRFQQLDRGVVRSGFTLVLLARLSPVLPFNLLNYAFGLTGLPLSTYVLASWLGMLPGTVLFLYLGASLGNLAEVATGQVARTPAQQALFVVGLVATLGLVLLLARLARRALADA